MYNSESHILSVFDEDAKEDKSPKRRRVESWCDRLNWVDLFILWVVLGASVLGLALWICSALIIFPFDRLVTVATGQG
jgi:hypothetical protein